MNELLYLNSPGYVFLPPAFYDALEEVLRIESEASTAEAISAAGVLAGISVSESDIERIATRLLTEKDKEEKKGEPPAKQKTFGTALLDWLADLKAKSVCYFLADFEPAKARALYFEQDMLLVLEALKLKSEYTMQLANVGYEGSLYGFGGKYEDDKGSSGPTHEFDLTGDDSGVALRSLKALKF